MDNNKNMDELVKLMLNIDKSIEMTRETQILIDIMKEDLMNETRPMMVEQRKKEISEKEQEKNEFDEMTQNALRRAKTDIIQMREKSEKEYQEKLVETVEKRNIIEKKLKSMEQKGLPEEKIEMARVAAEKALTKVNEEIKSYQEKHFAKRAKLDEYEADINNYALELGIEIEPLKESAQKIENKPENKKEIEENKDKNGNSKVVQEKTTVGPNKIVMPNENEEGLEIDENLSTKTELPKVASVEVKDNKYIITYETKEDGVYSTDKKECEKLGFFKGLFEKAKLIVNRKEYGIDLTSAIRADINIFRNLNDKDKEKYLSYIAGQTAGCFDINYDNPKSREAKALAKGQERLALKATEALEQYGPIIGDDVDIKQQIEDELILPEVNEEEHRKIQNKYDKMFGDGFDQHDNPPAVDNKENNTDKLIAEVKKIIGNDKETR